jgi:hypothetical protein
MKMDLNKIQKEVKSLIENNQDLINEFENLYDVGKIRGYENNHKYLIRTMNALCKKSKRVFLGQEDGEFYRNQDGECIGINPSGIGVKNRWSDNLSIFGSSRRWSTFTDARCLRLLLRDDEGFNSLVKAVNRNSIKDLKRLRNFYLKHYNLDEDEVKEGRPNFIIIIECKNRQFLEMVFSWNGHLKDLVFRKRNDASFKQEGLELHSEKALNNLFYDGGSKELILYPIQENEEVDELKEIAEDKLDINLEGIKILLFLVKHKKEIKDKLKKKMKEISHEDKKGKRQETFLLSILNPLQAVDNL